MKVIDVYRTGKHLKKMFEETEMPLCKYCEVTGITKPSVYRYHRGEAVPTPEMLLNLAEVHKTTIEKILIYYEV